jgi:hypothetical protein
MPTIKPILFSPSQYELLQMGLTIIMQATDQQLKDGPPEKRHENQERFREAASLSNNLAQNIMHGEGLTTELRQKFEQRIAVAHQNNDEVGVLRVLRDLIASLVRLEPDPAKAVANIAMKGIMRANSAQAGDVFIPLVQKKLVGLKDDYATEGYPSAQELLIYLDEWLAFGHANLKNGEEAWPGDEHLTRST